MLIGFVQQLVLWVNFCEPPVISSPSTIWYKKYYCDTIFHIVVLNAGSTNQHNTITISSVQTYYTDFALFLQKYPETPAAMKS